MLMRGVTIPLVTVATSKMTDLQGVKTRETKRRFHPRRINVTPFPVLFVVEVPFVESFTL